MVSGVLLADDEAAKGEAVSEEAASACASPSNFFGDCCLQQNKC